MNRRLPVALIACLAAFAALPTYVSARSSQLSVIQDDARVIVGNDSTRNGTLDEMKGLGADVIKITISWRDLANGGKPSNPEDPNAYPAAKWGPYDAAVQGAAARGLGVFLNVNGPAPDWASKGGGGATRLNAAAFGQFAKAVGTRYSGSFPPSGRGGGGGGGGGGWWWQPPAPALHRPAALRDGGCAGRLVALRWPADSGRPGSCGGRQQPSRRAPLVCGERAEPSGLPAAAALVDEVALSGLADDLPRPLSRRL